MSLPWAHCDPWLCFSQASLCLSNTHVCVPSGPPSLPLSLSPSSFPSFLYPFLPSSLPPYLPQANQQLPRAYKAPGTALGPEAMETSKGPSLQGCPRPSSRGSVPWPSSLWKNQTTALLKPSCLSSLSSLRPSPPNESVEPGKGPCRATDGVGLGHPCPGEDVRHFQAEECLDWREGAIFSKKPCL